MENSFDVSSLAKELGVSQSAIKKYYLLMEENDYRFTRDYRGRVIFTTGDFTIFNRLLKLKNEPGMNLKKAVKHIINEEQKNQSQPSDTMLLKSIQLSIESSKNEILASLRGINKDKDSNNADDMFVMVKEMNNAERWKFLALMYNEYYNTTGKKFKLDFDY